MKNRFKLNEEEKNRIKFLHGMQVINEVEQYMNEEDSKSRELLDNLLHGAKSLNNFVSEERRQGKGSTGNVDLKEIQDFIVTNTDEYMALTQEERTKMGYNKDTDSEEE